MSFTRNQWVTSFLCAIGNCNPSQAVVNWVTNWTNQEGGAVGGQGTYNLLNTTLPEPGSYGGGLQGNIQYFSSFSSGIKANATTLQNGLYPDLLNALRSNNINALSSGSGSIIQEMGTWGTGWNSWYGTQMPTNGSQSFPDVIDSLITGTTGTSTTPPPATSSVGSAILSSLGLPDAASVQTFLQQFMLVFFGGMIILIGVAVVFFSTDTGKNAAKTGAEVAAA